MESGTGVYASVTGTDISNDMLLKGGNRFGNLATTLQGYNGNIDLDGATRDIRISSQVTWGGEVSNGGLNLEIDSGARLTLEGDNTYTGPTTVNSGTLIIHGAHSSTSTLVAIGATLGGTGTLDGLTTINGTLAPGASPGSMTFESLTMGGDSVFSFELTGGSVDPGASDLVQVGNTVTLGSGVLLDLIQLGTHSEGDKFTLFSYGTLSGTFAGLDQGDEFNAAGGWWTINYSDDTAGLNGGTGSNFVTITAIPEPAAALLGGLGMLVLLGRRRHD
jgi:autotransporter-associated beta strand protein